MIQKLKPYYKKAIRTSLLAQDRLSKKWYHLFSVIELFTEDEYVYKIPNSDWIEGCIRAKQSKLEEYSLYLSIDEIVSFDEALKVFEKPFENFFIDGQKISFVTSGFRTEI